MYKDITFCKETDEEDYFDGFLGWKLKSASLMLNKDMTSTGNWKSKVLISVDVHF